MFDEFGEHLGSKVDAGRDLGPTPRTSRGVDSDVCGTLFQRYDFFS